MSIYHPLDRDDPDRPVASNIILDHVSASWGTDEVLSVTGSVDNVTVQWSIVSEGVTAHNCGSLLRPSVECHMSFHHNLYAHNRSRNPFAGSYRDRANHCDWRNNVIYNGGDGHGGTNWHKLYPDRWGPENVGRLRLNCINNYWIRGPKDPARSTAEATRQRSINPATCSTIPRTVCWTASIRAGPCSPTTTKEPGSPGQPRSSHLPK